MRISDWSSDVCSSDLILPADAFAVGLEKPPGDQRDAAGDEDHERPAGPAPPQVQRDDQRRQRRRASAIILQRVEKRIAHDKAPIKANSPAALNAGQAMGDRKSVVEGKRVSVRVDLGGRSIIQKKKKKKNK